MSEFIEKNAYTDSKTNSIYTNTSANSTNSSSLEKTNVSYFPKKNYYKSYKKLRKPITKTYKTYKKIRRTIDISKTDSEKSDSDDYDSETSFINDNPELTESSDTDVEKLILHTSRKKVDLKQKFKNLIIKRKKFNENHQDSITKNNLLVFD